MIECLIAEERHAAYANQKYKEEKFFYQRLKLTIPTTPFSVKSTEVSQVATPRKLAIQEMVLL
jgi:hypothetical protein